MRHLLLLIACLLGTQLAAGESLIPYDNCFVMVTPAETAHHPDCPSSRIQVNVIMQAGEDDEVWLRVGLMLNGYTGLDEEDIAALESAGEAARNGAEAQTTVERLQWEKPVATTFTSKLHDGKWLVLVERECFGIESSAWLHPDHISMVRDMRAKGEISADWFERLLSADSALEQTASSHPPRANHFYSISSDVGEVDLGELSVTVEAGSAMPRSWPPRFETAYGIAFYKVNSSGRTARSGGGMREMVEQLMVAYEDSNDRFRYRYEHRNQEGVLEYEIEESEDGEAAILTYYVEDETPLRGVLDRATHTQLVACIEESEQRGEWFFQNLNMFLLAPDPDKNRFRFECNGI